MKSKLLVFGQFFIIFLMTLPFGTAVSNLLFGLVVTSFGILIGITALYKNRVGNFNIRPEIKKDGKLITSGIYSYIRHPMYASVLVMMLGITILYPSQYEYTLYWLLIIVLLIKLFHEESLWKFENQQYLEYMKTTRRLVPFIF